MGICASRPWPRAFPGSAPHSVRVFPELSRQPGADSTRSLSPALPLALFLTSVDMNFRNIFLVSGMLVCRDRFTGPDRVVGANARGVFIRQQLFTEPGAASSFLGIEGSLTPTVRCGRHTASGHSPLGTAQGAAGPWCHAAQQLGCKFLFSRTFDERSARAGGIAIACGNSEAIRNQPGLEGPSRKRFRRAHPPGATSSWAPRGAWPDSCSARRPFSTAGFESPAGGPGRACAPTPADYKCIGSFMKIHSKC